MHPIFLSRFVTVFFVFDISPLLFFFLCETLSDIGRSRNEAYEKHRRICTEETPGGPLGMSKYRRPSTENEPLKSHRSVELAESSSGPLQYCCYLCGRHYGSHSLLLHVPRCKKLWEDREAVKSKKECRSVPPPPPEYEGFPNLALPTDPDEVLAFNNAVYSYWDRVSLLVCSICGRSFK